MPEVFHFDEEQALIVMERLSPHIILRQHMMAGRRVCDLGGTLGRFAARTAFRGSDLSMTAGDRKADVALFAGNVALCDITENLVFTDPYFEAETNRHTTPQLDDVVVALRGDGALKVTAQHLKRSFCAKAETLCRGDLHTGSAMVTEDEVKVIDPEFGCYGPFGFDIGMLIGNYLMAFYAMPGHLSDQADCAAYQDWLLDVVVESWDGFCAEFGQLWRSERNGMLYPAALYEDQGHGAVSEQALAELLAEIFSDLAGFAGIEMHRRILGLAHNADFEMIEDADFRAACERKALLLGRYLSVNRAKLGQMAEIVDAARAVNRGEEV